MKTPVNYVNYVFTYVTYKNVRVSSGNRKCFSNEFILWYLHRARYTVKHPVLGKIPKAKREEFKKKNPYFHYFKEQRTRDKNLVTFLRFQAKLNTCKVSVSFVQLQTMFTLSSLTSLSLLLWLYKKVKGEFKIDLTKFFKKIICIEWPYYVDGATISASEVTYTCADPDIFFSWEWVLLLHANWYFRGWGCPI